jgi:PAS fold
MFFDGQGRCLGTNRTGLSVMGYGENDLIGKKLSDLSPGLFRLVADGAVRKALAGGSLLLRRSRFVRTIRVCPKPYGIDDLTASLNALLK